MKIKIIIIFILCLVLGLIYFDTHYAIVDHKIYKNDITYLNVLSLDNYEIREINKCTEIEKMILSEGNKNLISKFINFHNLNDLFLLFCEISSSDSEKISTFDNLKKLDIFITTIDFKSFSNDTISFITLVESEINNLESLSKCKSLKNLTINSSTISNNCIILENNKYVMKDSSVFASFDYIEELWISVDKIEDISGILEMDSLKEFKIDKGTLSEGDKKLLEDKGISVIYYDKNK